MKLSKSSYSYNGTSLLLDMLFSDKARSSPAGKLTGTSGSTTNQPIFQVSLLLLTDFSCLDRSCNSYKVR
jgi:hypothetical protein